MLDQWANRAAAWFLIAEAAVPRSPSALSTVTDILVPGVQQKWTLNQKKLMFFVLSGPDHEGFLYLGYHDNTRVQSF